jgi:hypothetical protein
MEQPEGFAEGDPRQTVCLLQKSIYGTKQGGNHVTGTRRCALYSSPWASPSPIQTPTNSITNHVTEVSVTSRTNFSDFKDMSLKLPKILRVLNQQQLTSPVVENTPAVTTPLPPSAPVENTPAAAAPQRPRTLPAAPKPASKSYYVPPHSMTLKVLMMSRVLMSLWIMGGRLVLQHFLQSFL